jgi:hypothetical protein
MVTNLLLAEKKEAARALELVPGERILRWSCDAVLGVASHNTLGTLDMLHSTVKMA